MYHYTASGLRDVWLVNGFKKRQTPHGEAVSITDVEGLHRAIGANLVKGAKRLTGAEFRFLRKEQELSQKMLGDMLGTDAQSVARWEKGQTKVPKWADRMIRALYNECCNGDGGLRQLIERLNELDEQEHRSQRFKREGDDWLARAA